MHIVGTPSVQKSGCFNGLLDPHLMAFLLTMIHN